MDRRTLLLSLLALPLTRPASSADPRRLGFISTSTTSQDSPFLMALRKGLQERGYEEGKNISIAYCFASSKDELPTLASKLVSDKVELILAAGSEGIVAARDATKTIPIVMTNSGDAVREGFAKTLSAPGGNITGMTQISPELVGKRLEMLREIFPGMQRVAILWNPNHPNTPITFQEARIAAEKLDMMAHSVTTQETAEIAPGLAKAAAEGVRAVLVIRDPFTVRNRVGIVKSLNELRMLAIFETADFVEAGGLMYYGADFAELFKQSAVYVDQILKGASPLTLPIMQPRKFELVINGAVAAQRGIPIPAQLLARADKVIE
jgi:putative ABC transport system substrate-binding protein